MNEDPWVVWSDRTNKDVAQLKRDIGRLNEVILGNAERRKTSSEPALISLIKNVVTEVLHERKCMRDCGAWEATKLYAPGAAITDGGVLWVCRAEHQGKRPGSEGAHEFWRLTHKSIDVELRKELRSLIRDELRLQKGSGG